MQKATFAITFPHFFSHAYQQSLQFLHSMQKLNHTPITSIKSRFNVHGTLLIKQSNFLNFKNYPYDKGKPLGKADFIHLVATQWIS